MTGEEKRRQLKEQYKAELAKRKEILDQAKKLRKMQRINHALNEMKAALNDDSDEWIEQLNRESALTEAKLDVMMDSTQQVEKKIETLAMEAERERLSAENLVKQMKRELGMADESEDETKAGTEEETENAQKSGAPEEEENTTDSPPQKKTLGDF